MSDVKSRINSVLSRMAGQPKDDIMAMLRQEWEHGGQRWEGEWEEAFSDLASTASHGGSARLN